MKNRFYIKLLWCISLSSFALDANAWGLFTHIYFAQWLVTAAPLLLDAKIQQAIKKYPQLVMAGACLPDLAIISKSFNTTHQWHIAEKMLNKASTEQEIAIAVGYTSHLFVDVIAHNHFVPAHEAKWSRVPWLNKAVVTHIAAEWAMDAHIAQHVVLSPYQLITAHIQPLSLFIAPIFTVSQPSAKTQLVRLAWADRALRVSRLSWLILLGLKASDLVFVKHLNYYLTKTKLAMQQFDQSIQGIRPSWEPELKHLSAGEMIIWREKCLVDLTKRLATPVHYYCAGAISLAKLTQFKQHTLAIKTKTERLHSQV